MENVHHLMMQALAENVFPGGVLLVFREGTILFFEAYGYANIFSKRPMTRDTIFDLASVTKPLATTLAVMKLVEQGKLDIEQNLGSVLPQFLVSKPGLGNEKGKIKIKHLLGHNSGLPDHRLYYEHLREIRSDARRDRLKEFLLNEPLISPVGEKTVYSDLGFMILGWVIEHLSGTRLDRFVNETVFRPLGLETLFFVDVNRPRLGNFAATELCPWRNQVLEGLVHDDNAYTAGGIEGHAGLFGTAGELCVLLSELLKAFHGRFSACVFQRNILKAFFERGKDTERALGFDMPARQDASCGHYFSEQSVGHLGFTGTSFWIDLDRCISVILLTNRVHPSRDNVKIKAFRPKIHDAVMKVVVNSI
jgi:serine-type D-Ala-D-Ala carboxypeptidase